MNGGPEVVKTCKRHGILKEDETYIRKGVYYECRFCIRECNAKATKKYRQRHREKYLSQAKSYNSKVKDRYMSWLRCYRNNNRDKLNEYKKLYRDRNRERVKAMDLQIKNRNTLNMTDSYMRALISGHYKNISCSDISKELIECCRELLKLKRWLRGKI